MNNQGENNCDCKHSAYCCVNPKDCTLQSEDKRRSGKIMGRTTKQISAMQGRPGQDLK